MMEDSGHFVLVNGGTKKQRALIEDIAWWFCDKYFSKFKYYNIEFDLTKIEGNVQGWCMDIDKNASHIEIDKRLKGDDFITTIFHEMVHVKQYVRKELFSECNFYADRDEYLKLPWEIEAYKLQEVLLTKWNRHKKTS